jgi:putative ABC transport system permease protein
MEHHMSWFSGARARIHLLFASRAAESRIKEEVRFHIEMETERLIREEGLTPDEALRRARVNFGGVTQHTEALREGRGLAWLGGLSLDFKLGFRMLVKYPGLTIVGGVAMSFAICVGAVSFEIAMLLVNPKLSLPGGDRIVKIRNWDMAASREEPRSLHDFIVWREALKSVTDLGAYRDVAANLIIGGESWSVQSAEITADAFRIAPTPPLLGRVLSAADEAAGAPPVLVLGYGIWQTRFVSDSSVIGRSVQLGDTYATVVGVMREGFAFPVSHEAWTPLKLAAFDQAPRAGPGISIFGRLAPGATIEKAQTELTALGRRAATERPDTHERLQPQMAPYAKGFTQATADEVGAFLAIKVFTLLLLVLICGNVALLLFARAATRETELAVRSALGASRRRIVAQLFAEALVLGGVAAAVGVSAVYVALRGWGSEFLEINLGRLPFWFDVHLSPETVLYAIALTILSAVIAGVTPALKITRAFGSRMKESTAGSGGLKFGGVWTAVIVAQVAVTVAFPAVVYLVQREGLRIRSFDVGFRSEEYLSLKLEMNAATASGANDSATGEARRVRFGAALAALQQRVAAEPGVFGVTFVDQLPRMDHPWYHIELDEQPGVANRAISPAEKPAMRWASPAYVHPSYFRVLEAPLIAGREFNDGDLAPAARVAIVDRGFVDQVLQGRNPIGRRLRIGDPPATDSVTDSRPWYEIVGVVKDLGMGDVVQTARPAGVYFPTALGDVGPINMVVHVQGDPMSLSPKVRALAAVVDPSLRLSEFQRLSDVANPQLWIVGLWFRVTVGFTAIALLLSLAGIYAVLSFIVARRTREIGVRVALGASRRRVVVEIFRRPLTQVSVGVVAGGVLIAAGALLLPLTEQFKHDASWVGFGPVQVALLLAYTVLMFGVCLLACVVPTQRALRVQPTVALRAE